MASDGADAGATDTRSSWLVRHLALQGCLGQRVALQSRITQQFLLYVLTTGDPVRLENIGNAVIEAFARAIGPRVLGFFSRCSMPRSWHSSLPTG